LAALAALAGILGTIGMFFTQLALGGERRAREAIEELQKEQFRQVENHLDELDRQLSEDGDPRTEGALRDLRSLVRALDEMSGESGSGLDPASAVEIQIDTMELFRQCVRSLERTLQMWRTARDMVTEAARKPILAQRERLIADVLESIKQLGKMLAALQTLGMGEGSPAELARVRAELEQNLRIAKEVDLRMRTSGEGLDNCLSE